MAAAPDGHFGTSPAALITLVLDAIRTGTPTGTQADDSGTVADHPGITSLLSAPAPITGATLTAVTDNTTCADGDAVLPGITACRLCAGETLGTADTLDGGQLDRLRALEHRRIARLTLSDCLDQCERGDVVVVRPSPRAQRAGRPIWFERLAGDELTHALADWLTDGGPGLSDTPRSLLVLEIPRPAPNAV